MRVKIRNEDPAFSELAILLVIVCVLSAMFLVLKNARPDHPVETTSVETTADIPEETESETTAVEKAEEIIEEVTAKIPTLIEEPIVASVEEVVTTEEVVEDRRFDVPLDANLQNHIVAVCEDYNVAPELIFAMIDVESEYDVDVIGDRGNAFGLMQIQPRWHRDRMERLGVDSSEELLDPYKNVVVGIDFIAELIGWKRGLDWALMAYNGGPANANVRTAKVVNYYNEVMAEYEKLA